MTASTVETLILGAGLSGLSAAYHLGSAFHVLEKSDRPGGLCRSEVVHTELGDFTFDATGHWLHLRDPEVRALVDRLLPDHFVSIERKARIYSHGVYTHYPYQVNTHGLPAEVVSELLLGFHEAHFGEKGKPYREREPQTFADFILKYLGEGFAKHFMFPYNTKLYTVPPSELSAAWCGRFVPKPTLTQVVNGALGISSDSLGYNARFIYPKQGGIETLPRGFVGPVQKLGPLECNTEPVAIDWRKKQATLRDGRVITYRNLISSIPPQALVGLLRAGGDVPDEVDRASKKLRAVWTTYVNVGARGGTRDCHWVYFPEQEFAFYRAGVPSVTHPPTAPNGTCSFYVEFSKQMAEYDHRRAEREAVEGLVRCGMLKSADSVLFAQARTVPNSYVLYDKDYGEARTTIVKFLEAAGIEPVGRYGKWEYSSMEDAILQGREAARKIQARRAA
jgi:protoporphyrinogen oxidase